MIVVIVQAAIAALAYIFWSLFQAVADCNVRFGMCHCTNSNGEPIPIERKSGCVVKLEVNRESRGRNRRFLWPDFVSVKGASLTCTFIDCEL